MSEHPSFLELDLFHVTREGSPSLHAHLESCAECAAHLRSLKEPEPLPEWAAALPPRRHRRDWRWWLAPLGTVALVASLLLVVIPANQVETPGAELPAFSPKGHPVAQVHVRRGDDTRLLGSGEALRTGDRIRLSLRATDLPHYVVFAVSGSEPVELARGRLAPDGALIPGAWEVDDSPREETLRIVFSAAPLTDDEAREAAALRIRSDSRWTLELRLPKEAE